MNKALVAKVAERLKASLGDAENFANFQRCTIALSQLRGWASDATRPEVLLFLDSVKELPGNAAVELTGSTVSLVSDGEGNILAFR